MLSKLLLLLWCVLLPSEVSTVDDPLPVSALDPCLQPLKAGPCKALLNRYYFNIHTCHCEQFNWGGCEPNGNNFVTLEACSNQCLNHMANNDICELPMQPGTCKGSFPRWHYSRKTCKCEPFIYGGCDGNNNNFITEAECNMTCGCYNCPVCNLPAMKADPTGPICQAIIPRVFFNMSTCLCESFEYSGCGGNGNNFLTEDVCQDVCGDFDCPLCSLPIMTGGPVRFCRGLFPIYGYNTTSCQCEKFIYGGCGGNANRFPTQADCEKRCLDTECNPAIACDIPVKVGPCRAMLPRYFYNNNTCECEHFFWGGCDANANNFETMEVCRERTCECFETCENKNAKCYMPEDSGPCKALIPRFHYDALNCKCTKFNYGGCLGNSNNFESKGKCKRACKGSTCPVCNLPADSGPCKCKFPMYFYNVQTCQCEQFDYGGCGGNRNRYKTRNECESVCGSVQCPVCNLPPKRGPCKASLDRWYFDASQCLCKSFKYGGCKGNLNRFLTQADCDGSCGTFPYPVCSQPKQVGYCKAALPRWYNNDLTNTCEEFLWSGCQLNGNNFKTQRDCAKVCRVLNCTLPQKIGPCKAAFKRFYYDAKEGKCKTFGWGGCEPNGNNFKSRRACKKACH